jgi:hypothetical protein
LVGTFFEQNQPINVKPIAMKTKSQSEQILRHLKTGRGLTPIQALNKFGVFRLGARVHNLRKQGHTIQTKKVKVGKKTFAKYTLAVLAILFSIPAVAGERCYDAYEDPIVRMHRESAIRTAERSAEIRRITEQREADFDAWIAARRAQRALDEQTRLLREQNEILRKLGE